MSSQPSITLEERARRLRQSPAHRARRQKLLERVLTAMVRAKRRQLQS